MTCVCARVTAPNSGALALLAARAPLVEVGAGTGYWAATLRRRGVDVLAYDLNPPSAEAVEANAYHGHLPPFTDVLRGGPKVRALGDPMSRRRSQTASRLPMMAASRHPAMNC